MTALENEIAALREQLAEAQNQLSGVDEIMGRAAERGRIESLRHRAALSQAEAEREEARKERGEWMIKARTYKAETDAAREALSATIPVLESDLDEARSMRDADWEGQITALLDRARAALNPKEQTP